MSNKWYRYVNDSNSTVLVTFDVNTIEEDDNEDRILNAAYSVYYKEYFNKPIWHNAWDIVNEQIYLAPGEEVYVRPYVNDMMTSVYDFTINATPYNPVDYTIGTTISNVTLNRKDYTNYVFTPSVSGEYKLTASSETSFDWQIKDTDNNNEQVAGGSVDNATLKTFDLQKGHQYTINLIS